MSVSVDTEIVAFVVNRLVRHCFVSSNSLLKIVAEVWQQRQVATRCRLKSDP